MRSSNHGASEEIASLWQAALELVSYIAMGGLTRGQA